MPTEFLLIDGYNIIFADKYMTELAKDDLLLARDQLINLLENYKGFKDISVILVFDAFKVHNGIEKIYDTGNIIIIYTAEAETADAYIERTVLDYIKIKNSKVSVATSDSIEQLIIMSKGAERISARSLLMDLKKARADISKKVQQTRPIKNNAFMDLLDKDTAELLEKMRLRKK